MPTYGTLNRGVVRRVEDDGVGYRVEMRSFAPGRLVGPMTSTVHGLAVGDAVVVASLGQSRDDLMIVGRFPPIVPPVLGIDDITGLEAALAALEPPFAIGDVTGLTAALAALQPPYTMAQVTGLTAALAALQPPYTMAQITGLTAALADRATDAELAALAGLVTTAQGNITTLQGNVTSLGTADTALSGRITTLENRVVSRTYNTGTVDSAFTAASKVVASVTVPTQGSGINYNLKVHVSGRLFMSSGRVVDVYLRKVSDASRVGGIAYFVNSFGGNADITGAAPVQKVGPFTGSLALELYTSFVNPGGGLGYVPGDANYLSGAVTVEPV